MEINPIIVIGVPREGEGDAEMVKTNWQRAVDSGIGCVIINDDMGNKAAKDAKKAGAYVYVPGYAGEVSGSNYETESGAERVAKSLAEFDRFYNHDIVVNVHAHLPEMAADAIKAVMYPLADPYVKISTFVVPISDEEAKDEAIIKADIEIFETRRIHVLTNSKVAEVKGFFRKLPKGSKGPYYKQISIYAYRRGSLDQFVRFGPTVREMDENLEPERALANGMRVGAVLLNDGLNAAADSPMSEKPTYTKSALNKMREAQVVHIANTMGIDATVDDLKADTVAKILAAQT